MTKPAPTDDAQRWLSAIAAQVRARREAAGLSQMELAARSNLAHRHLQKVEAAEVNVTIRTLSRIAAALETEVAALLGVPPAHDPGGHR